MSPIYLLRHAKTEQNLFKADFDRELIEKGFHQVAKLIKKLKEENITFDTIICSPAKRTKQTSQEILEKIWTKKTKITFDENLYSCSSDYLLSVVYEQEKKNKWNTLIVWHNPSIENIVNHFLNEKIGHVKTCGIYKIN